jgi:tetratricopeptide (TPR) repeat protein/ferredoxin
VLIAVHLVMIAHIGHWLVRGTTLSPVEPSEAMELGKHGVVNAGAVFFAVAILSTAVFGRFFCGWGCHLVALQDLCRWLLLRLGIRPRPLRSRALMLVPLVAFAYMFLWPAAYRLWNGLPYEGLRWQMTTSQFWATFPGLAIAVLTFVVCGFVAVYVLGAKGFCTYACPYGAAFGLATRVAPVGIRVSDACQRCAHCTAACTSNVRVHEEVARFGMVADPGCMKCLDCVSVCPNDALSVGLGRPAFRVAGASGREPRRGGLTRGEEVLAAVVFIGVLLAVRGLYGLIPFLLSLGIASIMAGLTVLGWRLWRRPDLRFAGARLRRGGRLTRAGLVWVVVLILLVGLWAHSGWIRHHEVRGGRLYQLTGDLRRAALDLDGPLRPAEGADRVVVERARERLELTRRWGLVEAPGSALRLAWLAVLSGDSGGYAAAMARVEAGREVGEARLLQGRVAAAGGRLDEAVRAYARVVELEPAAASGYLGLGTLLARSGAVDRALEVFEGGVRAVPGDPDLHYNAGLAHAIAGRMDPAVAHFEAALAIDTRHRPALENLGSLLLASGRTREALPHLERAVDLFPDDASTMVLLARAYANLGETGRARAALERALGVDPGLDEARLLLQRLGG